jgi:hypothetical protein
MFLQKHSRIPKKDYGRKKSVF